MGPLVYGGTGHEFGAVRRGPYRRGEHLGDAGALAGLIVGGLWALWRARRTTGAESTPAISGACVLRVLYLMLIAIIMIVNFVPALFAALNHIKIVFDIPARSSADGTLSRWQDRRSRFSVILERSSYTPPGSRCCSPYAVAASRWEWRQNPGRCAPEWNAVDVGDLDDDGYGHHDAGLRNGIRAGKCDGSPCRAAFSVVAPSLGALEPLRQEATPTPTY